MVAERADTLAALAEVFREHGYEGASLTLIAKATGLGKGSLYNFFPGGKEEMAAAVLADIDLWFETSVFAPLREAAEPDVAVAAMFDAVTTYFRSGRRVCLVGVLALGEARDRFAEPVREYFANWVEALAAALVRGGRSPATAVALAEDAWNSRDPQRVALAYTEDSSWRNRSEFIEGREQIVAFLRRKWSRELDYRLIKELWACHGNRIAVRFAYEWHDDSGNWFRSYGNENWEFDANGYMQRRIASINDLPIAERDRKYHWPLGRRPDDHPGLSELGL
jgi:nuclear transport factor 2 (NTF2) superfamily protein